MKQIIGILILASSFSCDNFVNKETSEIGVINSTCLEDNAWESILKDNSIENIKDSTFLNGLNNVRNHFTHPKYILYFRENPKEIVGCDYYSIRVVFNPKLSESELDGLSPTLTDKEQIRIRNRVLQLLLRYECDKGKATLKNEIIKPAIYSKEYYDNK